MNRAALIAFLQPLLARLAEQLAELMLEEGELALEAARGVARSRLEEAFARAVTTPARAVEAKAPIAKPIPATAPGKRQQRCPKCGELGHNSRRHKNDAAKSDSDDEDEPVLAPAVVAIAPVVPLFADVIRVVDAKPPPDRSEGLPRRQAGHACSRSPGTTSRRRGGQPSSTVTRRSRTSTPGTWCAGD